MSIAETAFAEEQTTGITPDQKRGLAAGLLQNAIAYFEADTERLGALVKAGVSFEDWLNAGFIRACNRPGEMVAVGEASYVGLTEEDQEEPIGKERLDLFAVRLADGASVFIECAVVHRNTQDKWRAKIAWDAEKLRRIARADVLKMVVVYCCSVKDDVLMDPTWTDWFERIDFGDVEKLPPLSFPIGHGGQFALIAWIVP